MPRIKPSEVRQAQRYAHLRPATMTDEDRADEMDEARHEAEREDAESAQWIEQAEGTE